MVVYLAYGSTANFRFRGLVAKINISKEREGYVDRFGPKILEIDPVIIKFSRYSQVQSEWKGLQLSGCIHCNSLVHTMMLDFFLILTFVYIKSLL